MTVLRICAQVYSILGLFTALSQGLVIKPCASNGATSVEENTKDFVLACDDLVSPNRNLMWRYQGRDPADILKNISTCFATSCSNDYNVLILSSINEHTRRSHVIIPDVVRGRFPDGTWWCENGGQIAQCALDVIYTAKDERCEMNVDEDKSMVTGFCQISKMYSSHDHYSCQWFEANDNQAEAEIPASEIDYNLTSFSESGKDYKYGNCSFNKSLPSVSQSYRYRVVIFPGDISPSVSYTIVKTQGGGVSVTTQQTTQSTSTTSVKSTNPLAPSSANTETSVKVVTSPRTGSALMSTTSVPNVVILENEITTARYEGMGIGAGVLLAAVFVVVVIIFLVSRRRRRKQSHCGDTFADIQASDGDTGFDKASKGDHSCDNGFCRSRPTPVRSNLPPCPDTDTTENVYSSIPPTLSERDSTYLHPVPLCRDSPTTDLKEPVVNGQYMGGNPVRCLPNLPDKPAADIDAKVAHPMTKGKPVDVEQIHVDAKQDGTYKGHISQDLSAARPGNTYEMMSLPVTAKKGSADMGNNGSTTPLGAVGQSKQEESVTYKEEKENMRNEDIEKTSPNFAVSGFREKGADYFYMTNGQIALSPPI